MVAPIKSRSVNRVNLFTAYCDFCALMKSRRNGLSADVAGANRFICERCCERTGASSYEGYYGRADYSVRDWIFSGGGTA